MKSLSVLFKYLIIQALFFLLAIDLFAQNNPLGIFENHQDIGHVKRPGSATYSAIADNYTVEGSGTNIWGEKDEFHFIWKKMKGDFILTTQVSLVGKGVDPHRKSGWMIRTNLNSNSAHASVSVHGNGLASLQFRRTNGGNTEELKSKITGADVIQLERKGNTFIMSVAKFGDTFTRDTITDISLGDEVFAGLFVCAHNPDVAETGIFKNVRIVIPAKESLVPYKDYLGSKLEILDIETGSRKVIHQSSGNFEAPNSTPDGKALIFNSKGLLYRFDLTTNKPTLINTGFAKRNNNDHVLSFDGKKMGISNHTEDAGGKSIIYTLPAQGGTPTRITAKGPSYLHGWSPDGKFLTYTGERNGEYDIYKISSKGGEETRLTTAKGLDDGSEYTPDGKWIYFNSTRSGLMQIWRMKPDGSQQEQLTDDEFNNWFPHISPDGKSVIFISYGQDVKPDDHPYYKHVYLRIMPINGGTPKVVAYLYGGQGSFNVPGWSPDSKSIAFASNTEIKEQE
ncbi:MAG TPA: biopolymer transporter TolR [Cytophagales bacterium]|nr:biopolymer transporter TolR [Cytophagales bacterium]